VPRHRYPPGSRRSLEHICRLGRALRAELSGYYHASAHDRERLHIAAAGLLADLYEVTGVFAAELDCLAAWPAEEAPRPHTEDFDAV